MPTQLQHYINLFTTMFVVYWPALLALGAITTGVSQGCNAIGARFPRFAPVAKFVAHLSVDIASAIKVAVQIYKLLTKKEPPGGAGPNGGEIPVVFDQTDNVTLKTPQSAPPLVRRRPLGVRLGGLMALCLLALTNSGCTPKQREALALPVVSAVDAVGIELSQLVGWCQEHDVNPDTVAQAKKALADKDYAAAVELTYALLQASAKAGDPVPVEVIAALENVRGALAAQGVQDGMRALSTK